MENIGEPFSYSVNDHIVKSLKKIKNHEYRNFYAVGGSFRVIARLYMFLKKINLKVVKDFSISSQNIKNILKKNLVTKNKKINTDLLLNITKSRRNSLPYALNVLETRGRGPTNLMSPFKIFIICGSSLIFDFLK